ncbi:D-serine dehydratase transcriptional activator [Klebsiella pneumoniae]|uniref:D-serine dehydratase transcriptional activator n=1 Tax=Klebsiella pneumoniae TaxID=573 RepID=A0A377XHI5_KLEPN|nr:D-serine dehydratase transcriptional activator [Klebsiella pneumoniae]
MNHVGVAMGRKRLVQKRLESGELIAPFGDMTLKCHQHYYMTTLRAVSGRKSTPLSSGCIA